MGNVEGAGATGRALELARRLGGTGASGRVGAGLAAAGLVGVALFGLLPAPMALVACLAVAAMAAWATNLVPPHWPALAVFTLAATLIPGSAPVVFSGFQSSTYWLLFAGFVLGSAIRHVGLGARIAQPLARCLAGSYRRSAYGIAGACLLLGFVMPSGMGRIVLMLPIVMAVAEDLGYPQGSDGWIGLVAIAAFSCFLPAFAVLPSNAPNMILAGLAETVYGHRIGYFRYLWMHFPVLGLLKTVVLVELSLRLFPVAAPAPAPASARRSADTPAGPWTLAQTALALLLALCLVLWMTDALHGIAAGWVGLAAALVCLFPPARLTPADCVAREVQHGTLLFVAGVMGLGALISASGLGATLVDGLAQATGLAAPPDAGDGREPGPVGTLAILAMMSTAAAVLANLAGVPAILTPLAGETARLTGLELDLVLMTQVPGFSNVLLPYQAPPLIYAIQVAGLPFGRMTRLCLLLFAASLVFLLPLELLWWRLIGAV